MFSPWYPVFLFSKHANLTNPAIMLKIEQAYTKLKSADEESTLLRKYLNDELFEILKFKLTIYKATLFDVIRPGVEHPKGSLGVIAPDADAYEVFRALFDPIIEVYHDYNLLQHPISHGPPELRLDLDPKGNYIKEFRIQASRNVHGVPFLPKMSLCDINDLDGVLRGSFEHLTGDLEGTFNFLSDMPYEIREQMADDDAYFCDDDPLYESSGMYKHWPVGRGIFQSNNRNLYILVNHYDHLMIISKENGDWPCCVKRFYSALEALERDLKFAHDDRLGFLTASLGLLGPAIYAMCRLSLPKLGTDIELLDTVCRNNGLIYHTQGNCIFDILNRKILGMKDQDILTNLQDGIATILELEQTKTRKT